MQPTPVVAEKVSQLSLRNQPVKKQKLGFNINSETLSMSELTESLKDYQDFELAFLTKYRLEDAIADREVITDEIASRRLSGQDVQQLIDEKLSIEVRDHNNATCPRCTSQRISTMKEEFHGNNKAFGLDSGKPLTFIEYKVCSICGWNFSVDETGFEKKDRVVRTLVSVAISIVLVFLIAYLFGWVSF